VKRVISKPDQPGGPEDDTGRVAVRPPRAWSERELRLVDRLATVHEELDALHRERAALVAYVSRLHAGRVTAPDATGRRTVQVDTAVGRLSWRISPEDVDLVVEDGSGGRGGRAVGAGDRDTVTRLSFLHLHRRPNRPTRLAPRRRARGQHPDAAAPGALNPSE
jgi:hypothetical protein